MRRGCQCFWLFLVVLLGEKEIREQCFVRWDGEDEIVFDCFVWWKEIRKQCFVRWDGEDDCYAWWDGEGDCYAWWEWENAILYIEWRQCLHKSVIHISDKEKKITLARDKLIHWYTPQKT